MCCRISTTGFATRTIAGLYIFLATFLIGFFAASLGSWFEPFVPSESVNQRLLKDVNPPEVSNSMCEMYIHKIYQHMAKRPSLIIVNEGTKPIGLTLDGHEGLFEVAINSIPKYGIDNPVDGPLHEIELQPDWSYSIPYPIEGEKAAFSLSLVYRSGKSEYRLLEADFPQNGDTPKSCTTTPLQ
jgi:hypothetical protein